MALLLVVSMTGCGRHHQYDDGGVNPGASCSGDNCISLGTATAGTAGDLGAAGSYVILAKTGVHAVTTPNVVTGNVGISPAAATGITGFALDLPAGSAYSTSAQVTGKVYAPGYAEPTPTNLTAAVSSMEDAYLAATLKATTGSPACPGTGHFGSQTLAAGVYTCAVDVDIATATNLTLNGSATDVWVFQITGNLSQAANTRVNLTGGALPQNVFWQVSGNVNVLAGAHFEGILLAKTDITFGSLSSINGRLFSQTAINLNATTVTQP